MAGGGDPRDILVCRVGEQLVVVLMSVCALICDDDKLTIVMLTIRITTVHYTMQRCHDEIGVYGKHAVCLQKHLYCAFSHRALRHTHRTNPKVALQHCDLLSTLGQLQFILR